MIHQYFREITVHHVMSVSEERGTLNRQLLLGPGCWNTTMKPAVGDHYRRRKLFTCGDGWAGSP